MFKLIALLALILHISAYHEECGHQATFNKIFDGEVTAIDEFPWMALLEYKNMDGKTVGFGCSGILITKQHVLTTAHCIKDLQQRKFEVVRLGEYNISSDTDCVEMLGLQDCSDPPQDIRVENWTVHPQHHKHIHDIAVIKLSESANFTGKRQFFFVNVDSKEATVDFVRPICLPPPNDVEEVGQVLVATGWGRTENGSNSSIKLKVSVPVVPFSDCYAKYKTVKTILNGSEHLCAGSVVGKDTCTGDSGGPLMTSGEDAKWKVVGIISTGNGCGLEGWPAVYMRVAFYREWILEQIKF